jgi:NlpC/P60 family putative phage cell wall peptidase
MGVGWGEKRQHAPFVGLSLTLALSPLKEWGEGTNRNFKGQFMSLIDAFVRMFPSLTRALVVDAARAWIGTPYHHQASLRGVGTDCLGLVRGIWREVYGVDAEEPPAYTRDWAEAASYETMLEAAARHLDAISALDVEPGDVVIFRLRTTTSPIRMVVRASPLIRGAVVSRAIRRPVNPDRRTRAR